MLHNVLTIFCKIQSMYKDNCGIIECYVMYIAITINNYATEQSIVMFSVIHSFFVNYTQTQTLKIL